MQGRVEYSKTASDRSWLRKLAFFFAMFTMESADLRAWVLSQFGVNHGNLGPFFR